MCKILLDKVKLFEARLGKLETEQPKDCVVKKTFEEHTINIENTYNIWEEMISNNRDSIKINEDDLKLIKKMNLQGVSSGTQDIVSTKTTVISYSLMLFVVKLFNLYRQILQ